MMHVQLYAVIIFANPVAELANALANFFQGSVGTNRLTEDYADGLR